MGATLHKSVRRLLAGCAAGAVAVGLVSAGASAALKSPCAASQGVWTNGPWTLLGRPATLGTLTGAAVDADHPATVYATDGVRVARSTTGGCSWQVVLDLAARGIAPGGITGAGITSLVVPRGEPGRVYAMVSRTGPLPIAPIAPVLASFDGGHSWHEATGLPPLLPSRLRASPANPDVVYLSLHTGQPTGISLTVNSIAVGDIWSFYASTDGGRSWTRRSAGQNRARFAPDPVRSGEVWALGSETSSFAGPSRSADGGATWSRTPGHPTDDLEDADIDVFRKGSGPAGIVIAQGGGDRQGSPLMSVYLSTDEGGTFRSLPADGLGGRVGSVAFGRTPAEIVVSSHAGVYRYLPKARQWRDVDTLNLAPLMDTTPIPGREPSWWFWRPELLAVYREGGPLKALPRPRVIAPPPLSCAASREFSPAQLPHPPPATLTPLNEPIALEPSLPSPANFRLSLPRVPTRLDAYFLLDTSESMGSALDGVVCGLEKLVDQLALAGVDAQFGLGEFQDAAGLRYRRDVDIGRPGFELQNALRTRTLAGGEEPHRGALYQTATGAGLRDLTGNVLIHPGQQADYRKDALRVVLMVTDEPYQETTTYEPTVLQVIDALNARAIHHIGIHVSTDPSTASLDTAANDTLTVEQLREFSRGTRTFAPAGGVDCDGDGKPDVAAGQPLVCTVGRTGIEANLAQTLTNVLLAVRQDGVATLRPLRTDGLRIDVPAGQRIDVHADHTGRSALGFSVNVTCSPKQAGTRHTVLMGAEVSGIAVAQAPVPVTCGAVPPLPVVGQRGLAAAAPPPAVAPAPVPAGEPALGSSLSTSLGANPVPVPGVAVHGQMPGVMAAAPVEPEVGVETVSHRFSDAAAARTAAAGVLFGAFAVLEWRRRSARYALSRVGRRR